MRHTIIVFFKGIHPIHGSVKRFDCKRGVYNVLYDDHEDLIVYPEDNPIGLVMNLRDVAYYQAIPLAD